MYIYMQILIRPASKNRREQIVAFQSWQITMREKRSARVVCIGTDDVVNELQGGEWSRRETDCNQFDNPRRPIHLQKVRP